MPMWHVLHPVHREAVTKTQNMGTFVPLSWGCIAVARPRKLGKVRPSISCSSTCWNVREFAIFQVLLFFGEEKATDPSGLCIKFLTENSTLAGVLILAPTSLLLERDGFAEGESCLMMLVHGPQIGKSSKFGFWKREC